MFTIDGLFKETKDLVFLIKVGQYSDGTNTIEIYGTKRDFILRDPSVVICRETLEEGIECARDFCVGYASVKRPSDTKCFM